MTPLLDLPKSRAEIERLQSERKKHALAQARRAPFYKGKLDHVNAERLDDPDEWRKIPLLDKDTLRKLDDRKFYEDFCLPSDDGIAEYWRSGGATGTPLFYPRSYHDIEAAMIGFARIYDCTALPARRPRACVVSARHSPGGPDAGTGGGYARHRRQLGGLRRHHALGHAARIDRAAQADDLDGHEQLRPASRQSCRGARARSRGTRGRDAALLGRAAVRRQARQACAPMGRAGARHVRHDRSRHDGRGRRGRARLPHLDRYVPDRSARSGLLTSRSRRARSARWW